MGWRTVVDVRDYSAATGSTYTVAVMLAERAPDETRVARPGLDLLARDSRVSKRTCQRALAELERLGEVERIRQGHRGSAAEFLILVGNGKGDKLAPEAPAERVTPVTERVPTEAIKGDTRDAKGDTDGTPTEEPIPTEVEPNTSPDVDRLCQLMADRSNERSGRKRPYTVTKSGLDEMRRLIQIDGREVDEIEKAIEWVHHDAFWGATCWSPENLRRNYDTMRQQAQRRRNGKGSVGSSSNDLRERAAQLRAEGR